MDAAMEEIKEEPQIELSNQSGRILAGCFKDYNVARRFKKQILKIPPFEEAKINFLKKIQISRKLKGLGESESQFLLHVILQELQMIWSTFGQDERHSFFTAERYEKLQERIYDRILTSCEAIFEKYQTKFLTLQKDEIFEPREMYDRLYSLMRVDIHKKFHPVDFKRNLILEIESGKKQKVTDLPDVNSMDYGIAQLNLQLKQEYGIHQQYRQKLFNCHQKHCEKIIEKYSKQEEYSQFQKNHWRQINFQLSQMPHRFLETFPAPPEMNSPTLSKFFAPSTQIPPLFDGLKGQVSPVQNRAKTFGGDPQFSHPKESILCGSLAENRKNMHSSSGEISEQPWPRNRDQHPHQEIAAKDLQQLLDSSLRDKQVDGDFETLKGILGVDPLLEAFTYSNQNCAANPHLNNNRPHQSRHKLDEFPEERENNQTSTVNLSEERRGIRGGANFQYERYLKRDVCNHFFDYSLINKFSEELEMNSNFDLGKKISHKYSFVQETLPNQVTARIVDTRISELEPKIHTELSPHPPMNPSELRIDVDANTLAELDWNLMEIRRVRSLYNEVFIKEDDGEEITDVYTDLVPCAPPTGVKSNNAYGVIRQGKIVNLELLDLVGRKTKKFAKRGRKKSLVVENVGKDGKAHAEGNDSAVNLSSHAVDIRDYLRFLGNSAGPTDFLSTIFNLTENEHFLSLQTDKMQGNSLGKSDGGNIKKENVYNAEIRERKRLVMEIDKIRTEYRKGYWNSNCINFGGLSGEPDLDGYYLDEDGNVAQRVPESREKKGVDVDVLNNLARMVGMSKREKHQTRLENLWKTLKMPEFERLNMIVKYSDENHLPKLPDALESWDKATKLILQRERILQTLESFERCASDPRRFFLRTDANPATTRLEEASEREKLLDALKTVTRSCISAIRAVEKHHADVVTFRGRCYLEKMQCDYTEMLYWLQQERLHEYQVCSQTPLDEQRSITTPFAYLPFDIFLTDVFQQDVKEDASFAAPLQAADSESAPQEAALKEADS